MQPSLPLFFVAVFTLLLVATTSATQYHIYVRTAVDASQRQALASVATIAGPNTTIEGLQNSVWQTAADADADAVVAALGQVFASEDVAGQLHDADSGSRRRSVGDTAPMVIIDTVKEVAKSAVASWGIDRIDQRSLPLSNSYTPDRTGAGVTLWIVDTGVDAAHAEFGGRASTVYNTYEPPEDCDGHGTHVASTAAGATVGVARQATIKAVKVLNCNGAGTTLTVALGLQHVYNNRAATRNVINMSLGYGVRDYVVEGLIDDLYAAGVTMVAAAGNANSNACGHFPSAHANVISVASSTSSDARSSFSNYGTCVTLFAPGSSIVGAKLGGGHITISGTSMASPHVAGAAALALQSANASPASVLANLLNRATLNKINGASGSPNRLLYALQDSNPPQSTTTTTTTSGSSSTTTTSGSSTTSSASGSIVVSGALVMAMLIIGAGARLV